MNPLSLAGRTVVVTRARKQASRLGKELEALGSRVIEVPAIDTIPPDSYDPLDAALRDFERYQWLVVTSANTVRVLSERLAALGIEPSTIAGVRVVAVGSATAAALREAGFQVDLIPSKYVGESVVETLREQVAGTRVLLARAAVARDVIPDELRRLKAVVDVVDAYRTIIPLESAGRMRDVFSGSLLPDAVTFTSSSTVTNFFYLLRETGLRSLPGEIKAISIGPVTSATLREQECDPAAEADPHDVDGLVQATIRALAPTN